MCMEVHPNRPDWKELAEIAISQEGMFTTQQAAEVGYSPQLLVHHVGNGRMERVRRGIYRLAHFPAGDHEELVVAWLWSGQLGVVSHQTALELHDLSDVLPSRLHLTMPIASRRRRLRVPVGVVLHYADVPPEDRISLGVGTATNVRRTLNDCARASFSPELLEQAAQQALHRGIVTRAELGDVEVALAPFGGLAA